MSALRPFYKKKLTFTDWCASFLQAKNKSAVQSKGQSEVHVEAKDLDDDHYSLIHNELASRVHGQIHEKLRSLPEHIATEAYIFETDK